ncbi:MAG: hypothetical protein ACFFC3_14665 [Candidatus Odinarchaeota archaeon]
MIEEPFVFLVVLLVSLIATHFLLSIRAGGFRHIFLRLFFIGVYFHEASHYIMCVLVGAKPEEIKVKWREEHYGFRYPHGYVTVSENLTFLQAFLIATAPLYLSTWLLFFLWYGALLNSTIHIVGRVLAGVIIISLLLNAAPSTTDFHNISTAFRKNPLYSWYQILLVLMSTGIVWLLLHFTPIIFFLDMFYYLAIAAIYFLLKFSLIRLRKVIIYFSNRNYSNPSKVRIRPLTHKHYKPKKPPKRV